MREQFSWRALLCSGVSATAIGLVAAPAWGQGLEPAATPSPASAETPKAAAPSTAAAPSEEVTEIVVTGFRASLNNALNVKRKETASVDSIVAEDIGKFPDSNLAESMQRVPGVTIARGDSGEGKSITVRGLGAQFTRVRLNGMEGASQTGSSDIYGAQNNGRSFDFNAFPSEIFSSLTARKTASADVEEGSLGATVDLRAPRPLDYKQSEVLTFTAKGLYNELRESIDPRFSVLGSKKFGDGKFGVLGAITYQERNTREVGYSAVDILSANTNGYNAYKRDASGNRIPKTNPAASDRDPWVREVQPFCTPIGWMAPDGGRTISPDPFEPGKGASATNCSSGNPRTGSIDAYNTIYNARRPDALTTPGSGAYFPRIPRYTNSTLSQERIGGAVTLQFKPDESTDLAVDLLYSRYHGIRHDNYIAAISFARSASNNGQPMTSVEAVDLSDMGSVQYGKFDGVDVRSEGLVDNFVSTFKQVNLDLKQIISDDVTLTAFVGVNNSKLDTKNRYQYFMDAIDTPDFTIDYRDGGSTPLLGFGFDVSDPNNFRYAPGASDGTVYGGFSLQGAPRLNNTDGVKTEVNLDWKLHDAFTAKVGAQYRSSDFTSLGTSYYTEDTRVRALPAGTNLSNITMQITGVDKLWGRNAPPSWVSLDPDKLWDTFNLGDSRACTDACGVGPNRVREKIKGGYLMGEFDLSDLFPISVRGDAGVRYVHTNQLSSAYVSITQASTPTGTSTRFASVDRSYENWLPSANLVIEPVDDVLLRFAGAKVIARPDLGSLTPSSGVNPVTRTGSIQNPYLEAIKATTFDAGVEWYFQRGALLSAAYFYKNIGTYIQSINSQIPFNELGLPNELLDGSNTAPTELFTVSRPVNTSGGPLKGVELNAQMPLTFLPGILRNLGVLANFTHVTSDINYVLTSVNGVPTVTTNAALVGLSKNTASGTLYYEDDKFSIRSTVNYRDGFIRGIPASPGSDLQGNDDTVYVDASASYSINSNLKVSLEAQNLTDEQNRLYIDSIRQDTLFETRVGRTYTVGLTYKY